MCEKNLDFFVARKKFLVMNIGTNVRVQSFFNIHFSEIQNVCKKRETYFFIHHPTALMA